MNLSIKNKINIQIILNLILITISIFFIINFVLLYSNISESLSDKYFRGIFLSQMIFSPFLAVPGIANFFLYEKNEKIYNKKYKNFFIASLILSIAPLLIIIGVWN